MRSLSVFAILTLYIRPLASVLDSGPHHHHPCTPDTSGTPSQSSPCSEHDHASLVQRSTALGSHSRPKQALDGTDLALLQRAGAQELVVTARGGDDDAWGTTKANLAAALSRIRDAVRPLITPSGVGFLMAWACATLVFIACACTGFCGLFDGGSTAEDNSRSNQAKPLRQNRANDAQAASSYEDESGDGSGDRKTSGRWPQQLVASLVGNGNSSMGCDGYGGRQMVHDKRQWLPAPLYTGPALEGDCVFLLPLSTIFRKGRGETQLLEASDKLELRVATLGSEGWPLVVFVGTGRMPVATIGPALQDTCVAGPGSLELRSGDGSHYGVLDRQGADKCAVRCGGSPLLTIEGVGSSARGKTRHLNVLHGDGTPAAEVRVVGEEEGDEPSCKESGSENAAPKSPELELRIFKGSDPVLAMMSVLTMLLSGQGHGGGANGTATNGVSAPVAYTVNGDKVDV